MKTTNTSCYLQDGRIRVRLSPREVECLVYLLQGKLSKQISEILNVSHRTVGCYISCLRQKLNCYSQAEVIEKVLSCRLLFESTPSDFQKKLIQMREEINSITQPLETKKAISIT